MAGGALRFPAAIADPAHDIRVGRGVGFQHCHDRNGRQRTRSARLGTATLEAPAGAGIGGVGPATQATPMSAHQASEIVRLRQENERPSRERDIKKGRTWELCELNREPLR